MMISTRGRYALRVLVDLAENQSGAYIPLKDIVNRQHISQKYLESIMTTLSKAGLVDGVHGKGGGYRLNREPADYTLGEILRQTEGDLAPVACVVPDAKPCHHSCDCGMLPVWTRLEELVNNYLDSVTLEDIRNQLRESKTAKTI